MLGFASISLPREPQGDGVERGLDEKSQLRHVADSLSFSFLICEKGSWGQGVGFPRNLLSSLVLYSPVLRVWYPVQPPQQQHLGACYRWVRVHPRPTELESPPGWGAALCAPVLSSSLYGTQCLRRLRSAPRRVLVAWEALLEERAGVPCTPAERPSQCRRCRFVELLAMFWKTAVK